jgi:Putative zinc-finger
MTCDEVRALFSAHVDGDLEPAARARVNDHLATCPACQRELARFQRVVAALQSLPEARAPAGLLPGVMAHLPREPWMRRLLRSVFVPLPLKLPLEAAAVMLVAILTVVLYRGSPQVQPAVEDAPTATAARPAPGPASAPREAGVAPAEDKQRAADAEAPQSASSRPEGDRSSGARTARKNAQAALEKGSGQRSERVEQEPADAPGATAAPPARAQRTPDRQDVGEARDAATTRQHDAPAAGQVRSSADPGSASRRPIPVTPTRSGAVEATLRVKEPAAADRALPALLSRAGATLESRGVDGSSVVILVPRSGFRMLTNDLKELGDLTLEALPDPLPDPIRITVRVIS